MPTVSPAPALTPKLKKPVPPIPAGAEYASVEQTAVLLGVSRATVYRCLADGSLAQARLRGRTLIPIAAAKEAMGRRS